MPFKHLNGEGKEVYWAAAFLASGNWVRFAQSNHVKMTLSLRCEKHLSNLENAMITIEGQYSRHLNCNCFTAKKMKRKLN